MGPGQGRMGPKKPRAGKAAQTCTGHGGDGARFSLEWAPGKGYLLETDLTEFTIHKYPYRIGWRYSKDLSFLVLFDNFISCDLYF